MERASKGTLVNHAAAAVALTVVTTGEAPSVRWLTALGVELGKRERQANAEHEADLAAAFAAGVASVADADPMRSPVARLAVALDDAGLRVNRSTLARLVSR